MQDKKQTIPPETIQLKNGNRTVTKKDRWLNALVETIVNGLLVTAVMSSLVSMFGLASYTLVAIVAAIGFLIFRSYFSERSMVLRVKLILSLGLMLVLVLLHSYAVNGLFLCWNMVAQTLGMKTGVSLQQYQITIDSNQYPYAIVLFVAFISIGLAASCYSIFKRKVALVWIGIVGIFVLQLVSGLTPTIISNISLFFSGLLITGYVFNKKATKNTQIEPRKFGILLYSGVLMLSVLFVCFGVLQLVAPISTYSKNSVILDLRESVFEKIDELRFEKQATNSFTQGDFKNLDDLELSDTTALHVVMDHPTSLYLRGFVGEKYTAEAWEPLSNETYFQTNELFYWLHKGQFNALNQLSTLNGLISESQDESVQLTIQNEHANSHYIYTPYELKSSVTTFKDTKTNNDSSLISTSFFGERSYSYTSSSNLVTKYPKLANAVYAFDEKDAYLKNESHYNKYVYENYVSIPEETKAIVANHVDLKDELQTYEEKIQFVQSYVNDTLTYNLQVDPLSKNTDFIQYLLEDSTQGFATHYATLATVLFRYLGVPARYVEGYLITPDTVEKAEPFEELSIKGTDAHAWTEIYIDAVGWIPVEVTPAYYDVMAEIDLSGYPSGNLDHPADKTNDGKDSAEDNATSDKTDNGIQQLDEQKQEPPAMSSKKAKAQWTWLQYARWILSGLLAIALFIGIFYILKNRHEVKKRHQSFLRDAYPIAVPRMFTYTLTLLKFDGVTPTEGSLLNLVDELKTMYSQELVAEYKIVLAIHQCCLYSQEEPTKDQYNQMYAFMCKTKEEVLQSKTFLQKLKMKYWYFIY